MSTQKGLDPQSQSHRQNLKEWDKNVGSVIRVNGLQCVCREIISVLQAARREWGLLDPFWPWHKVFYGEFQLEITSHK